MGRDSDALDPPRADEDDWWPHGTSKISGRLVQEDTLVGLEDVSPGKNMQFDPYVLPEAPGL
jgi:hypothetical protein